MANDENQVIVKISARYLGAMAKLGEVVKTGITNVYFVSPNVMDFLATTSIPFKFAGTKKKGAIE